MRMRHLLCVLVGLGLCPPAHAADQAPDGRAGQVWLSVGDRALDGLRGGFDVGGGLLVSFGITRAVYINGEMVAQTSLNFGRISNLTAAQAAQLSRQMAALNVVQNGPGNSVEPASNGTAVGTIIQNTLDNQHIVNQTVINASSNASGMMKSLNTQGTLNDALYRGIPR